MKSHLKRLAMPRSWLARKKDNKYIIRPHPGGIDKELSISLQVLLRDVLKIVKTAKETRYVLTNKEMLVNKRRRREPKFPVSFMDTVSAPEGGWAYRMTLDKKGKLVPAEIDEKEAGTLLCKITGKTKVPGGKIQLNFMDGSNIMIDKDVYKTGDVVVLKDGKPDSHIKLEKGNLALIVSGKHVGEIGTIEDIQKDKIIVKDESGEVFETSRDYAFMVGKDKPLVTLRR